MLPGYATFMGTGYSVVAVSVPKPEWACLVSGRLVRAPIAKQKGRGPAPEGAGPATHFSRCHSWLSPSNAGMCGKSPLVRNVAMIDSISL
jgi:hypothetical protein